MRLDERGKQCPLPVIEAKKALEASAPGEKVEVVVDNEIAVQNLSKMADHKGLAVCSEKTGEREFLVTITAGEGNGEAAESQRYHCRFDHATDGWILFAGEAGDRRIWRNAEGDYAFGSQQRNTICAGYFSWCYLLYE